MVSRADLRSAYDDGMDRHDALEHTLLRIVLEMVRDDVTAAVKGAAMVGNNVLRVMSDAPGGLTHLVLRAPGFCRTRDHS